MIVATDEYSDPKLTSLNAPARDARILADVLRDEAVGGFGVETVFNRPSHEVELAIAEFFGSGKYGDTLLAHFSCHGVKSPSGELYFATTNTDLSDTFKLKVTGVPSALVRDALEESRASLILCLVDCCYSGAFVKLAKAADTVDLTERLGGKGRAVITASTSLQLALDGEEEPSLFTHAVIDGLRTGEADRDLDGLISLDELYNFVHDRVTTLNPNQTPVKSFDVQGEVYVARRSTPVTRPAPLEPDLLADAHSSVTYKRLGAVSGLASILDEKHPGRSLAARLELARLSSHDDSLKVREQAQKVLDAAGELPAPVIPDYEPALATRGGAIVDDLPVTADPLDTDISDAAETETKIETEIGTRTGAGDSEGEGSHPGGRRRVGLIVLGLVSALHIGGVTWLALDNNDNVNEGGENRTTSGGEVTGPVLPDTEILLGVEDPDLGQAIVAFDADTAQTRPIISDRAAFRPTISQDRQWLVYLTDRQPGGGGIPRLARVDGTEDALLLDAEASETCPYTTRPAFSQDGGRLALLCVGEDGETLGLATIDRGGTLTNLVSQGDFEGAPTWNDEGRIIVARAAGGTSTLWEISPDGGEQDQITEGLSGSHSHPDWSEHGLLFLREQDGSSNVYYLENLDDPNSATDITVSGDADGPAWAPGDEAALVWLQPAENGGTTLWFASRTNPSPIELNTADYGPPAWGSR
ncbi:MAG: caspase, EACC1-associated type [Nocardioides sp.]